MLARACASLLFFITTGALAALPDYDIIEIYQGNAPSHAYGVSNTGIVVGCYGVPAMAFTWQNGQRTDLSPGCGLAVNDSGVVGGYDSAGNAVLWNGFAVTQVIANGQVYSVNNAGWAVGFYNTVQNGSTVIKGFLYHDGQVSDLPQSCGKRINNRNEILCGDGTILEPDGSRIAMPGTSYPTSGYDYPTFPSPQGLTDQDQAVGTGRGLVYYANGTTSQVPNTPTDSVAVDLNSTPILVGNEEGAFGYIATPQGDVKFFSSMPGLTGTSWSKLNPTKINESGWIAGWASHGPTTGSEEAFLLVPKSSATPPPPVAGPGTPIAGLPVMKRQRGDFNGDFRSDLLWKSDSGSNWGVWLMDGTRYLDAAMIAAPANATLAFRGDFNGDQRGDLVFQDADGSAWMLLMNGTGSSGAKLVDGSTGWRAVGAGDFDGDGRSDLLWYHPSYGFAVWLMNGASATSASGIAFPAGGWPAAIGDFNGDGRDDIAWIFTDGRLELSTMNGLTATPAGTIRAAGSGFVPAFVANFNGDGRDDIVWHNADGRWSLWLMNGASSMNSTSLLDAGSGWDVIGTPDLNGDGLADLIFVGPGQAYAGWLMSGTAVTDYRLFTGGGSGWSLLFGADLSGDGKADLVWQNGTDKSVAAWLMNGLDATQMALIAPAQSGWSPTPN